MCYTDGQHKTNREADAVIELQPELGLGSGGSKTTNNAWIVMASALFILAIGVVILATDLNVPFCLFMVPIGFMMLIPFVLPLLRNRAAARKLDPVTLEASTDRPHVGDPIDLEVSAGIKTPVLVERTRLELVFREWVRYQSGTDTVTKSEEWVIQQSEQPGGNYQPGAFLAQSVRFVIPANAMHSFHASDNRCIWLVRMTIDVQGWADWKMDYPIMVVPALREGQ